MIRRVHKTGATDWGEAIAASAVVHVAAAIFVFDLVGDINLRAPEDVQPPPITVTSLVLGNDTVTTSSEAGNGETASPETAPDSLAPVDPSDQETLTPVAPEDGEGTDPEIAEPLTPDEIAPISPDDTPSLAEPSILRPTESGISIGGAVVSGEGTAPVTPERVGAVERLPIIDTSAPIAPPVIPGDGDVAASGEINELVQRIRAQLDDPCLLAIPQQTASGTAELVMLGDADTGMRAFADIVLSGLSPRPSERSILVDNRQCGALNYVRQSEAYPAFRLTVTLDAQVIESGSNLTGTIGNVGGRYVSLLLIDDNGVVQDLGDYMSFRAGFARFDVPLNRAGLSRDTSQILMAIGSAARPRTLDAQNGQLSNTYFTALRSELGPATPMVIVPFDIR